VVAGASALAAQKAFDISAIRQPRGPIEARARPPPTRERRLELRECSGAFRLWQSIGRLDLRCGPPLVDTRSRLSRARDPGMSSFDPGGRPADSPIKTRAESMPGPRLTGAPLLVGLIAIVVLAFAFPSLS
jgi:hypothetical protein